MIALCLGNLVFQVLDTLFCADCPRKALVQAIKTDGSGRGLGSALAAFSAFCGREATLVTELKQLRGPPKALAFCHISPRRGKIRSFFREIPGFGTYTNSEPRGAMALNQTMSVSWYFRRPNGKQPF